MRRSKNSTGAKQEKESWQLQAAKARFSELFRKALSDGPQIVTRQGKEKVVVLTVEYFEQLKQRARQPQSLVRFFAESPLVGLRIEVNRSRDAGRDVEI